MADYNTTDFYATAVLIAMKFEVKEVTTEGTGNKIKRFHFEDTPALRETLMKYMNGTLTGSLREFRNAIDSVKDLVHGG